MHKLLFSAKCFYYFVHHIYVTEDRLNNRNTSVYNAVSTKSDHYNLHEGGFIGGLHWFLLVVLNKLASECIFLFHMVQEFFF